MRNITDQKFNSLVSAMGIFAVRGNASPVSTLAGELSVWRSE